MKFKQYLIESEIEDLKIKRVVYHGSNKKITDLDVVGKSKRLMGFIEYDVDVNGIFFTDDVEDAKSYGKYVGKYEIVIDKLLIDPRTISVNSKMSDLQRKSISKIWDDVAYILEPLIENDGGVKYISINNGTKRVEIGDDGDEIYEFFDDNGLIEWGVLDNSTVVSRMKKLGYDGAKVQEYDDHSGYSWFIVDKKQVKFIEMVI